MGIKEVRSKEVRSKEMVLLTHSVELDAYLYYMVLTDCKAVLTALEYKLAPYCKGIAALGYLQMTTRS